MVLLFGRCAPTAEVLGEAEYCAILSICGKAAFVKGDFDLPLLEMFARTLS